MPPFAYHPELTIAREAANAAAEITRKYFANLKTAEAVNKSDESGYQGIVTRADVEAETAIIRVIRNAFPDHHFMAEEEQSRSNSNPTSIAESPHQESDHLWIIDPIDGTNNFAHGIPHYAISIACYENGNAKCGVVLQPESGDEFIAQKNAGAWHNGKRVSVNHHKNLSDTMISVGFYYDRGEMMRATLNAIEALFQQNIHGIRRMGTAALDIVQVGLGRFGGFFEYQLSPWDFAAARLFLEEAGGKITTCDGLKIPLEKTSILATNSTLHASMLDIVRQYNSTDPSSS